MVKTMVINEIEVKNLVNSDELMIVNYGYLRFSHGEDWFIILVVDHNGDANLSARTLEISAPNNQFKLAKTGEPKHCTQTRTGEHLTDSDSTGSSNICCLITFVYFLDAKMAGYRPSGSFCTTGKEFK